jgi:predicted DNA-binding protein (MmcQ/YjbR family)
VDAEALAAVIEAKPGATCDHVPSAKGVTLYKVAGKMFAILSTRKQHFVIVKCDPHLAEILREQYASIGHRSHLDRRFWISIDLDGDAPAEEIERLVAGSYDLIVGGLTKKQKAELAALA